MVQLLTAKSEMAARVRVMSLFMLFLLLGSCGFGVRRVWASKNNAAINHAARADVGPPPPQVVGHLETPGDSHARLRS